MRKWVKDEIDPSVNRKVLEKSRYRLVVVVSVHEQIEAIVRLTDMIYSHD